MQEKPSLGQRMGTILLKPFSPRQQKGLRRSGSVLKSTAKLLIDAYNKFVQDQGFTQGAALAYYSVFSLPAILFFIVYVIGGLLGQEMIQGELLQDVEVIAGEKVRNQVQSFIENVNSPENSSWIAQAIGLGTLAFSSTVSIYTFQNALNIFWQGEEAITLTIWQEVRERLIAFLTVVTVGILLFALIVVEVVFITLSTILQSILPNVSEGMTEYFNHASILMLSTAAFSSLFKFLPRARIRWEDALVGGLVTALLFLIGQLLIGWYLGRASFGSVYGAASSLIFMMAWVFYSAQILLFGAEFTYVYTHAHGSGLKDSRGTPIPPTGASGD